MRPRRGWGVSPAISALSAPCCSSTPRRTCKGGAGPGAGLAWLGGGAGGARGTRLGCSRSLQPGSQEAPDQLVLSGKAWEAVVQTNCDPDEEGKVVQTTGLEQRPDCLISTPPL